ncbi:MAG: hypothetical protein M1562_02815 [Candidatus Marsarchaeota archaeon]|nr:hypothetical protein [Candidatus Marsarchaeota archaeon]
MLNIYEMKRYKLLAVIPISLLIISLFFIPKIHMDSTLTGGTNVQITTNTTMSVDSLSKGIDAVLPGSTIQKYGSSISITIPPDSNLTAALADEELINSYFSNYSTAELNTIKYQTLLSNSTFSNNATTAADLSAARSDEAKYLVLMATTIKSESGTLSKILGTSTASYNSSNARSIQNAAIAMYSNASYTYKSEVLNSIKGVAPFTTYSYNEEAPQVGKFFLQQIRNIIIIAFILVGITVFVIFRDPVPSIAVIFGAANDIIIALGAMGAFGIPLGVASIGGLLMLLGYSIDTDVLVAVRVLKRSEGTPTTRAMNTFKTGVTMTTAAIISFLTLFIIAYIVFIPTYIEIAGVALFGLIADIATTWLGNTVFIVWHKRKKESK